MRSVVVSAFSPDDPGAAVAVREHPDPEPRDGWAVVEVRAASLNKHDVFTLRGVDNSEDHLPIVLGCDAAGVDETGAEVIVHCLVADADRGDGDELNDPRRVIFSGGVQGTFADKVLVPKRNLVPKPSWMTFEQAACLPTAWLTAYRMMFVKAGVGPGDCVLVQGAGGGVATAAIQLGAAAGLEMWATSRSETKRARALELGAAQAFPVGARLPRRAHAVIEPVGQPTLAHSLASVRPGGRVVIAGALGELTAPLDLMRFILNHISLVGSSLGSLADFRSLVRFCDTNRIEPLIDSTFPIEDAKRAFARMEGEEAFGKIVLTMDRHA